MQFKTYKHDLFDNTFTLAIDGKNCVVIDPCFDCKEMIADIKEQNLNLKAVLITHGHFDHTFGSPQIHEAFPAAEFYINENDVPMFVGVNEQMKSLGFDLETGVMPPYKVYPDGEFELYSGMKVKTVKVPGHTPGSVFVILTTPTDSALFTGDVVYSNGGLGFWEHSMDQKQHEESMQLFFTLDLPLDTPMFAGHGPTSTYGAEVVIPRHLPIQ